MSEILVKADGEWTDDPVAIAASMAAMANKDALQTQLIAALEAEIARLREERLTNEERGAIRWGTAALLDDADITEKRGMAQRSKHSRDAAEMMKRLLDRQPLPPGAEGEKPELPTG